MKKPMNRVDALSARRRLLGHNLSIAYDDPVKIVRGSMQYLYDDEGRQYLDAYNNIAHVGHCHPRVVEAAREQLGILNTNTRYLHDSILEYADKLTATLPSPLSVCFFVNSGSEANELALRLARTHTRAHDVLVLDHAYHGNTTTLIDISPYKFDGPGGKGAPSWVHKLPLPDSYRGMFVAERESSGQEYAKHAVDAVLELSKQTRFAAFIAESMPSVGGQIILPEGYLAQVYDAVRQAGGVCIADEVQTGYGRLGSRFWGFEEYRVVPDIVVLGKPIGNGHPIGAVITTREIADSFDNGMEFFSSFGGNTVSCAVGITVLQVVQEDRLAAHAERVGGSLIADLKALKERHAIIGDVRGSGFFIGLDLVKDRTTREPATATANAIVNQLRQLGILLGTDGPFHNVLKIRPPMPFSSADATQLLETIDKVLAGT